MIYGIKIHRSGHPSDLPEASSITQAGGDSKKQHRKFRAYLYHRIGKIPDRESVRHGITTISEPADSSQTSLYKCHHQLQTGMLNLKIQTVWDFEDNQSYLKTPHQKEDWAYYRMLKIIETEIT